jgi:phosphatidylglycerophosphate synthase
MESGLASEDEVRQRLRGGLRPSNGSVGEARVSTTTRPSIVSRWELVRTASIKEHGYPYTKHVNRRLARPLTLAAWALGANPNQVSVLSFLVTFGGLGVFLWGAPAATWSLAAYGLLVLGYALDAADGQLARVRAQTSLIGDWFDHGLDAFKMVAVPLALGLVLLRTEFPSVALERLATAAVFVNVTTIPARFFLLMTRRVLIPDGASSRACSPVAGPRSPVSYVMPLTDYGVLMAFFLVAMHPDLFLWAFAAYGGLNAMAAIGLLARTVRWGGARS